jgi:hypothetical protein
VGLQQEIDEKRKDIYTNKYSISIGELLHLYHDGELDVHPEFQRFLRWDDQQKTDLIESILLGIPIPPIFVAQRTDGVWDVIDGLQRLGTILQFVGVKKDEAGNKLDPLILRKTKSLPSLEGKIWENPEQPDDPQSLTGAQRLLIKRSSLDITIVLKESDEQSKYELFMRLNRGGSLASDQEVRNRLLVSINKEFFRWMDRLHENQNFQESTALTDRKENEQYGMELLLRFIILRKMPQDELAGLGLIGEFLTDRMLSLVREPRFDYRGEEDAFQRTFTLLNREMGSNAFRKWDGRRFTGGFSISAFEGVALGLGYHIENPAVTAGGYSVEERAKKIWEHSEFLQWTGVGRSAGSRIPRSIRVGREVFAP